MNKVSGLSFSCADYLVWKFVIVQFVFVFWLCFITGAMFGTLSWVQGLSIAIGAVLQDSVYAATVKSAVGTVFWMGSGFYGLAAALVVCVSFIE